MNLHQFRFVREAVRQNFNLTTAAKALFTSQPGVSKAIIELEDELGVEIFRRHGKRIRSLTEPGKRILTSIERILDEVETLKRVGKDFASQDQGSFVIATTHTQARYALPKVLTEFTKRFPKVRVSIQQGNPGQIAELLTHDRADIAIATEGIANTPGVLALPGYQWQHVIKTYVETGMGVGIIAGLAYDSERDRNLKVIPVGHLFGNNVTHLGVKQGAYLRSFVYTFIELFSPTLTHKIVEQAMSSKSDTYEI